MAFSTRYMSVLGYAAGFTHWAYAHRGPLFEVLDTPGFFEPARDMIKFGDVLFISGTDGTAARYFDDKTNYLHPLV
jgi:hypothetical protein